MDKKEKISERLAKNLPTKNKTDLAEIPVDKKDIKDDYEFSRETYKDLIRTGTLSMDALAELARESEHPRAFEVVATLVRTLSDANIALMDLSKKKQNIETTANGGKSPSTVNNTLFVGSTGDLQKLIKKQINESS